MFHHYNLLDESFRLHFPSGSGIEISAHTADCPVAAAENAEEKLYAIQFHPEVLHTVEGTKMINNFVKNVCGCAGDWKMDAFVESTIEAIRAKVGDGKVLLRSFGRRRFFCCCSYVVKSNRKAAYLRICRSWFAEKR